MRCLPNHTYEIGTIGLDTADKCSVFEGAGGQRSIVQVVWEFAQLADGGALDATYMAGVQTQIDYAVAAGLKVVLEICLHYPPVWAKAVIPEFVNQDAEDFTTEDIGSDVRDWVWTQTGRDRVSDFVAKTLTALSGSFANITTIRIGGGYYGELHYPYQTWGGRTLNWWSFGAAAQLGTDLATGQTVCPLSGYIPYGAGSTVANDAIWVSWHINGLMAFASWLVGIHRMAGWSGDLNLLTPGFGRRTNWAVDSDDYKASSALGEVFESVIRAIGGLNNVWPHSTWMDAAITESPTADSDYAPWQKLYTLALLVGKTSRIGGENTSGAGSDGMDKLFATTGAMAVYSSLDWIDYSSLSANGGILLSELQGHLHRSV